MMPVTADWLSTRQLKSRHRGNDIEAGLALQAQRLQSERIVESADQPVGAAADAHGRTGRGADITAVQCALPNTGGQREDGPTEDHVIAKPDLGAEALYVGLIMLRGTAGSRREDAIECARRKDNKTRIALAPAAQLAGLDRSLGGCGHRRNNKAKQRGSERRASNKFERHDIPFYRHLKRRPP